MRTKLSNVMRKALEIYATPGYEVENCVIQQNGRYVGRIDQRTWLAMRKRGYIADNSMTTKRATDEITDTGIQALGTA